MKKKCLRLFNKKTPLYAGLGSKQKTFSNCQATCQKELCLLFENQIIFSQSEHTDMLDLPPPVLFSLLFKDNPLHNERTFWMTPRSFSTATAY